MKIQLAMDIENSVAEQLEWLQKKDDTLEVVGVNADGSVMIESDLEFEPNEQEVLNSADMLNNEARSASMSITNRVVQIVFLVNASFSFIVMIFAFIPYYILSFDETRVITFFLFGAICVLTFLLYMCCLAISIFKLGSTKTPLLVVLVSWMFSWLFFVGTLSAVVKNIAPLQAAAISFVQSLASLLLVAKSQRNDVDLKQNAMADVICGFFVWLIGIYSFVNQRDWISAVLLILFNFGSAAYITWQISLGDRFCLSRDDKIDAVGRFYMDPILQLKELITRQTYEIPVTVPSLEEEL